MLRLLEAGNTMSYSTVNTLAHCLETKITTHKKGIFQLRERIVHFQRKKSQCKSKGISN